MQLIFLIHSQIKIIFLLHWANKASVFIRHDRAYYLTDKNKT